MQNILEQIHHQIFGANELPKCVFLHGIMGQGKNWRTFAKRFSSNLQCLIYDQRGHGQSFQPERGYDPLTMADDLKSLLDGLGWDQPLFLVGHSMGGRVALAFAHKYPKLVKKLVIVDIGPTSDWQTMQGILDKLDSVPVPFASREEAKAFFSGPFTAKFGSQMLADFFYSNIQESESGKYDWIFYRDGIKQGLEQSRIADYWKFFHELSMPSLLIRGAKSEDLKAEDFAKVVANNPQLEGIEVQGAGHWVHADQPTETIKILQDFFEIAASPS